MPPTPDVEEGDLPISASAPGERIKQLRRHLGLSQKIFAARLNLSQSTLSQIENDRYNPSYVTLAFLASEFDIDCNWLLKGKGTPFAEAATAFAQNIGYLTIPEKARAGYSSTDRDEHWLGQLDHYLVPGFRKEANLVIFQSLGDSMDPTILDQDFVLGERITSTPENYTGHCVVCVVQDQIYVKRLANFDLMLERLTLGSDNPKYKTVETPWSDILEIWHIVGRITRSLAPSLLNQEYRIRQLEASVQDLTTTQDEMRQLVVSRLPG